MKEPNARKPIMTLGLDLFGKLFWSHDIHSILKIQLGMKQYIKMKS